MMDNITYGVVDEGNSGFVVSRMGDKVKYHVFSEGWTTESVIESGVFDRTFWTKKIPTPIKNIHRKAWGLKPLPTNEKIPKDGYVLYAKGTYGIPQRLTIEKYDEKKMEEMGAKDFSVVVFYG
jgi:hypothetical protein